MVVDMNVSTKVVLRRATRQALRLSFAVAEIKWLFLVFAVL